MKGKINRLAQEKNFGFIETENGRVVFFRNSALKKISFNALKVDDSVEFNLKKSLRSPRAENIRILES